MPEVITTELKSDLERIYKQVGDILNAIDSGGVSCEVSGPGGEPGWIKSALMDVEGTLQKDIFNCDYLITKMRTLPVEDGK